jgi:hypothetical protein
LIAAWTRRLVCPAIFLTMLGSASIASAQTRAWPERIWISAGAGLQAGVTGIDDAFELPLYVETERVSVDYPAKQGVVIDARGGYRLWKRFTVGIGVTHFSHRDDAAVQAQLPHPFFDNQFRSVEGTTSAQRAETGAHVLFGWMLPLSDRLRLVLTAGPSVLNVEQTLVTDVQFAESYPYDTATFTGATTKRVSNSATGFNAGADVIWMFSSRIGAGGLVQFTRARARLSADSGRTIGVDAGGVQATFGVRLAF